MLSIIDKCKHLVIRRERCASLRLRAARVTLPVPAPCWNTPERRSPPPISKSATGICRCFAPEDLLYARFDNPALQTLNEQLAGADGLIIATPVYKASFSGALKTLLDLLPERALEGKIVLPLATGGTIAHMLAVDYALKPVLNALKAQEILHGVFADDSQVTDYQHKPQFTANLQRRLDDALETFWQALHRPSSRAPSLTSLRGVEHA